MTDHEHVSDLRWDRWLAGELSEDDRAAAASHAASCTRCGDRLRELEAERDAFAVPMPRPRRTRWWWAAVPVAAAAAFAVVLAIPRRGAHEPHERTKGNERPKLSLSAGRPGHLTLLGSDDAIHPGQYLQAGYSATADGFGAVLSLDGAGQASAYVPASGDALVALPAGVERSFPGSTVLDDVVGTERVAIVWCETARPLAPLLGELRTTGQLAERDGCTIRIVVLAKVAP